jgi:hypothetical protein
MGLFSFFYFSFLEFLKKDNFKWAYERPSFFLWKRFQILHPHLISKKQSLALLNYEHLRRFVSQEGRFQSLSMSEGRIFFYKKEVGNQLVTRNQGDEKKLLKLSSLNFYPHEVGQIQIITRQKTYSSKAFHGCINQVGSFNKILNETQKLLYLAKSEGADIQKVELKHTHPTIDLLADDGEELKLILGGLSSKDVLMAKAISQYIECKISIKAITPSFSYSLEIAS